MSASMQPNYRYAVPMSQKPAGSVSCVPKVLRGKGPEPVLQRLIQVADQ
jgi:hypothetical protein